MAALVYVEDQRHDVLIGRLVLALNPTSSSYVAWAQGPRANKPPLVNQHDENNLVDMCDTNVQAPIPRAWTWRHFHFQQRSVRINTCHPAAQSEPYSSCMYFRIQRGNFHMHRPPMISIDQK